MGGLLFKNLFDYVFAALALVLTFPFFVVSAISIKLCSKGPVFYTQDRVSVRGRRFTLYKFRTMVQNADKMLEDLRELNESDGPVFKIRKDPRIIPFIGTFLRKTSLDELPQLINVLKGEMSLVGPRPPIPEEVDKYEIWHRRRLSMKPGLSCTWQIAPKRNDISFDGWMKMDLDYIDNWSFWLDCKIIFLTMRAVIFGSGR
jgi:lipopolysaccharide/colanic/teichoic acid biosynthesis glycosyltransferase